MFNVSLNRTLGSCIQNSVCLVYVPGGTRTLTFEQMKDSERDWKCTEKHPSTSVQQFPCAHAPVEVMSQRHRLPYPSCALEFRWLFTAGCKSVALMAPVAETTSTANNSSQVIIVYNDDLSIVADDVSYDLSDTSPVWCL